MRTDRKKATTAPRKTEGSFRKKTTTAGRSAAPRYRTKDSGKENEKGYGSRPRRDDDFDRKPRFRKDGEVDKRYRSSGDDDRRPARRPSEKTYGSRPRRDDDFERKPRFRKDGEMDKRYRNSGDDDRRPARRTSEKSYSNRPRRDDDFERKPRFRKDDETEKRYRSNGDDRRPARRPSEKSYGSRPRRDDDFDRKPRFRKDDDERRPTRSTREDSNRKYTSRPRRDDDFDRKPRFRRDEEERPRKTTARTAKPQSEEVRLNKFLANSGLCSRREADEYITAGLVTVNGTVVTEMGVKVKPSDDVRFNGERMKGEQKVYIVMNKPKDYVTTMSDPHAKHTVMDLISPEKCSVRVYPVGRLDKNTTGVLLLTNDGELTEKLSHPSHRKKKIYHVHLDRNVKVPDLRKLVEGIELEDGLAQADHVEYVEGEKSQVGLEIHSGRNRIVRRMFEALDYKVLKLDRVYFGGLTKKNLARGQWRFLTEQEVSVLRMGAYE